MPRNQNCSGVAITLPKDDSSLGRLQHHCPTFDKMMNEYVELSAKDTQERRVGKRAKRSNRIEWISFIFDEATDTYSFVR
mmetsp:Transcript_6457/g.12926  ORF Transcript_6457/g.12926 Transcript_6457/m.12926 type:complete len:80 (+) Transcript_6457:718-957(+)